MDGDSPVTPLSKASPFIARRFLLFIFLVCHCARKLEAVPDGALEDPGNKIQTRQKRCCLQLLQFRVLHLLKDPDFSDASLCSLHPSSFINMEACVAKHSL